MTEDAGLQWKRGLLNQRRASLQEEARRAGPEPMPGIDWKAWHDRREWREMMMIAIDEAEVRLDRDSSYIIGASSGAGFGYSEGFDPETGGTWRQSRDGGPAFQRDQLSRSSRNDDGVPAWMHGVDDCISGKIKHWLFMAAIGVFGVVGLFIVLTLNAEGWVPDGAWWRGR